jgi:swainsonine biosynthesis oxidoreductase SwnR
MKVAIAGTGDVSSYLVTELTRQGHDVVILTRQSNPNPPLSVPHRVTDYTVPSLVSVLEDRTALVSTVSSYDNPEIVTPTHLALLSAVEQSKHCNFFIPSEWTSDVLNYPDQPLFMREHQTVLYDAMRKAKERKQDLQWTVVCNSWFVDYIVPAANRKLRDIGPMWPMDWERREFTIYGSGEQMISFVPVRDVAIAVGKLLEAGEKGLEWEDFTFVEGDRLTWNALYNLVNEAEVGGGSWTRRVKSLSVTVDNLVKAEKDGNQDWMGLLLAQFELLSYSGASLLPRDLVQKHREKYFESVKFRTPKEVLELLTADPDTVV